MKTIEETGIELAKAKEIFIIEELTPYFEEGKLKQKMLIRLQEKEDYKKEVLDLIKELGFNCLHLDELKTRIEG